MIRKSQKKEILEALKKKMKNNKTPGTDGFTVEFKKKIWTDLGTLIHNSFKDSLHQGKLPYSQTQGIISILLKGQKPREYLKNWRPISLLNTTYKLLSSILANRIKPILLEIIHENHKSRVTINATTTPSVTSHASTSTLQRRHLQRVTRHQQGYDDAICNE